MSISGWIKTTQTAPGVNGIIGNLVFGGLNGYLLFGADGNLRGVYFTPTGAIYDGDLGLNGGPVADGNWRHVAMSVDDTGGTIYVDGVAKQTMAWGGKPGPSVPGIPLFLGLFPGGGDYAGLLDDARVYNVAMSPEGIQQTMKSRLVGNEVELLALYRLDEGVALTARDSSPTATNGTLNGPPIWVPSDSPIGDAVPVTLPADGIAFNSATLVGLVNPGGLPTIHRFEYGPDTNYGDATADTDAGSAILPQNAAGGLTGLTAGATYHYGLVAVNAKGTFYGEDLTFATVGLFTTPDVVRALQLAAGLDTTTSDDRIRLALPGVGELGVDLLDAALIAGKVAGLDSNP